jgi:preprotein translocase subunit SecE
LPEARLTRRGRRPIWPDIGRLKDRTIDMAKTSPGEFIRQVRAEAGKIVWPTGRETMQTTIMVLIMTTILALFFLGIDTVFNAIVNWLTSLAR